MGPDGEEYGQVGYGARGMCRLIGLSKSFGGSQVTNTSSLSAFQVGRLAADRQEYVSKRSRRQRLRHV